MGIYMKETRLSVGKIVDKFLKVYKDLEFIEFGVVAYKDHRGNDDFPEDYPIRKLNFTKKENCMQFINELKEGGGFDIPEALADGLEGSLELSWIDDSLKFTYLITDSPPHGK